MKLGGSLFFCDLLRTVKKNAVWFVGEEGRDTGGLSREMWRIFSSEIQRMCEGKEFLSNMMQQNCRYSPYGTWQ